METRKHKADPLSFDWLPDALNARPDMRLVFEKQVIEEGPVSNLAKALTHEKVEVRRSAIWFLGVLGDKRGEKALLWVFANEPDVFGRGSAADWLGHLGTKRAVTALLGALQNDPEMRIRERAASGLRSVSDKRVIDVLIAVMANKEEDPLVREMVAEAIGWHNSTKAAPVLVESLSDSSPNVRYWSASALSDSGYEQAITELERLAREDTSICFEPNTQSDSNPQGLVNGSICCAAARAMISIKEDLNIPLNEEESVYRKSQDGIAERR